MTSFFIFVALKPLKKKKNLSTRSECKCWLFVWHITFVLKYVASRASGLNIDVNAVKKEIKLTKLGIKRTVLEGGKILNNKESQRFSN